MQNSKLITSSSELVEICSMLQSEAVIAVDTEFFWERTFYPILGLVQVATSSQDCYLIDAVALDNLHVIGKILENESIIKIFHDAPQDLGILARETESQPCHIFDTRTSAGFSGLDSTFSLQNLLKDCLDIDLAKSETRSNWLKRPLTESQLNYAADDVVHLPALREYIIQKCSDSSALKWMEEENRMLDNPESYGEREPREMFRRVKGSSRLNGRQLAILRELAEWRENKARHRDIPRNRVLSNSVLMGLAVKAPDSIATVKSVNDFPHKMPAGVIKELITAIQRGQECPDAECPEPTGNSSNRKNLKQQIRELQNHIIKQCDKHRIDAALVASRADLEAFILNHAYHRNSHPGKLDAGWRKELVKAFVDN